MLVLQLLLFRYSLFVPVTYRYSWYRKACCWYSVFIIDIVGSIVAICPVLWWWHSLLCWWWWWWWWLFVMTVSVGIVMMMMESIRDKFGAWWYLMSACWWLIFCWYHWWCCCYCACYWLLFFRSVMYSMFGIYSTVFIDTWWYVYYSMTSYYYCAIVARRRGAAGDIDDYCIGWLAVHYYSSAYYCYCAMLFNVFWRNEKVMMTLRKYCAMILSVSIRLLCIKYYSMMPWLNPSRQSAASWRRRIGVAAAAAKPAILMWRIEVMPMAY